jgi:hypothetical protein
MGMGDNLARQRTLPRSTLAVTPEAVEADAASSVSGEDVYILPEADSPYAPYGRGVGKPEETLNVLLKDGYWRGFDWCNFDSVDTAPGDGPGSGPVLVLRFAGLEPTELRLSARNHRRLHGLLIRKVVVWIRELPSKRGFELAGASDDKAEVITAIAIHPWEPEQKAEKEKGGKGGG